MIDKIVTMEQFTSEERVKALEILIKRDISHAIEFASILKKYVNKEKSQILGELIRCLKLYEIDKAKKWLEKYKSN